MFLSLCTSDVQLGDRIAIMAHGKLRAIGNSITLKRKFGAGYRVSVYTDPATVAAAKKRLQDLMPTANLEDDSAGALIYQLPMGDTGLIPKVVKYLDSDPDGFVKTWGISQTTLEEVFLRLIRAANPGGYSGYEKKTN